MPACLDPFQHELRVRRANRSGDGRLLYRSPLWSPSEWIPAVDCLTSVCGPSQDYGR